MNKKNLFKLCGTITCIHLFVILFLVLTKHTNIFFADETNEVIQMYTHMYDIFHSGSFSLWDSNVGLGASSFVHFWTVLGSPSFYLFLLLPSRNWIPFFIPIVNYIRSIVLGILSYHYLHEYLKVSDFACFIGSLILSFNSFTIFFAHYPYFADFILYTILLMIGCEKAFNHKYGLLLFIVTFSSISNLYNVYMNLFFLLVYFSIRIFMLNEKVTFKCYITTFLKFLVAVLLGLGCSAIVLIPNIKSVLSNYRVSFEVLPVIKSIKDIFAVFTSLLSPITNDYDYNMYVNAFVGVTSPLFYSYSSILFVYCVLLNYKNALNKYKPLVVGIVVLILLEFTPYSNLVLNGNNSARWGFFLSVLCTIFVSYSLSEGNIFDLKHKKSLIYTSIILVIACGISVLFKLHSDLNKWNVLVNTVVLIVIASISFYGFKHKKEIFVIFSVAIEMLYCLTLRYFNNFHFMTESFSNWSTYSSQLYDTRSLDTIRTTQDTSGYYRIDQSKIRFDNYNDALMQHYEGFSSYLSVYNFETYEWANKHFSSDQFVPTIGSKYITKELAGLRYFVNYNDSSLVSDDMTLIEETDDYKLYKNTNEMGLGYSVSNAINQSDINDLPVFEQDVLMQHYAIVEKDGGSYDEQCLPKNKVLENHCLKLSDKDRYIVVDYSIQNKNAKVVLDYYDACGNSVSYKEIDEYSYTIDQIPDDAKEVYIYVTSNYNENEYLEPNLYLLEDTRLNDKDIHSRFTNVEVSKDSYCGDIEILDDHDYVVTSIGYDSNWKVYDNDKEIKIEKVNNGFVGFTLSKGSHHIVMKYKPNLILYGIITGISIMGAIWYINRKENNQ